jgi:O-antigen/teichoic acid export membrane protein
MRIASLLRPLSKGFVADSATIMAGTMSSQVVNFVAAPILARLYTPAEYGRAAVVLATIALFTVVACGRYDLAIMLPEKDGDAIKILFVSLLVSVVASSVVGLGYTLLALVHRADSSYLWLVWIGVAFGGFDFALSAWTLRRRAFARLAMARASNGFVAVGVQLVFGVLHRATATNLLIGTLAGYVCSVVIQSSLLLGKDILALWNEPDQSSLWELVRRYSKFPLVEAWGALLNSSAVQLPVFILNSFFPESVVGHYSMAFRLIAAPVTLLAAAVSQVFFQRAAELRRMGAGLHQFSYKLYTRLLLVGLIPFLPMTLFGQTLFSVFLGGQWTQAGLYAQYLGPSLLFQLAFAPLSFMFIILEKQYTALLAHLLIFSFPLAGLLLGVRLSPGDANQAIAILGTARVVLYLLLAWWTLRLARAHDRAPQS